MNQQQWRKIPISNMNFILHGLNRYFMFQNIIKVNYIALKSKFPPVLVPICQALTVSMNNIDQMF